MKKIEHTDLTRQITSMIQTIGNKSQLRAVSGAIRDQWDRITARDCRVFRVGDAVTFDTKAYGQQSGIVKRVNMKTLSIDCPNGPYRAWRVSPEGVQWTEMIVSQKPSNPA